MYYSNFQINNRINKFLVVGDKFMPEMHLRQPQFVYSACGPFTRHKERIKKFKQTGDTRYIYRNDLDKACFQHDSAYADHKDLLNRTKADKVLKDKATGSGTEKPSSLKRITRDVELHKPVIKKFNKRKVYLQFKDNIWGVDLADMQSLSKKIKVLNIFYVL